MLISGSGNDVIIHISAAPSLESVQSAQTLAGGCSAPAPAILNDARLFKLASHQSNRRPPDPEHLRKKFLGQRKDIGIDPIPGLEQPTG